MKLIIMRCNEELIFQSLVDESALQGLRLGFDLTRTDDDIRLATDQFGNGYAYVTGGIEGKDVEALEMFRRSLRNGRFTVIAGRLKNDKGYFWRSEAADLKKELCMYISGDKIAEPAKSSGKYECEVLSRATEHVFFGKAQSISDQIANFHEYLTGRHPNGTAVEGYMLFFNGVPASFLIQTLHERYAIINFIATASDFQRKGMATRLIMLSLWNAKLKGKRGVFLRTARRYGIFFKKLGFSVVKSLELFGLGKFPVDVNRTLRLDVSYSATLRSKEEVDLIVKELNEQNLPQHSDLPKNWDSYSALTIISRHFDRRRKSVAILDAGGEFYSAILPQLQALGFEKLKCINISIQNPVKIGRIEYEYGDITGTAFGNNRFSAIVCLSVIEHLTGTSLFFDEMYRILKTNGLLFISTDYWHGAIDVRDTKSFGRPVQIFDKEGIYTLIEQARSSGFSVIDKLDLECADKVINHQGLQYTFVYFTLQKRSKLKIQSHE